MKRAHRQVCPFVLMLWRPATGAWHLQKSQPLPLVAIVPGEYGVHVRGAEVLERNLREYAAEVGREREVATFVELLLLQTWPFTVDLLALHVAADDEHRRRVTVVRPTIAILPRRAAELRHRENRDVRHAVAEVLHERADRFREIVEPRRQLARRAALIHVCVPSADVGERDLQTNIRFDELRDLTQMLAERRPRILRAVARNILLRIRRFENLHGLEHLSARPVYGVGIARPVQGLDALRCRA